MEQTSLWHRFARDPRAPENAGLRAGHADRELVLEALTAAYADGRLDLDEFEQRSEQAHGAKTLADLPPLLADLVPSGTPSRALVTPADVQQRAMQKFRDERAGALRAFLVPSLICWAIWLAGGADSFPWPLFVTIPTLINLIVTLTRREDIIASEVRRIERRAEKERLKALKKVEERRALEAPSPAEEPAADQTEESGTGN